MIAHDAPTPDPGEAPNSQSVGRWERTNPSGRASNRGMVRSQTFIAVAVATFLAGACQEESSDQQSALGAGAQESTTPCPVEGVPRVRSEVGAVAFAYGEGPVFVGLGTGDGVVRYTVDTKKHDGWYYYKTLWAIAPNYIGSVAITGKQIGGPNELRFNAGAGFPGRKLMELRFAADDSGRWRYGPSDTLIRAPGFYAFRVKGDDFEQNIVFRASD
jgi:hypothetical protein